MGEVLNKISNKVIEIIKTLYQKIVSGIKSLYLPAAIASVVVFLFSLNGGNERERSTLQKIICIFVLIAVIVLSYYNENNKKYKVFLPILLCVLAVFNSFVYFKFDLLNEKSRHIEIKGKTPESNKYISKEEKERILKEFRAFNDLDLQPTLYSLKGDEIISYAKGQKIYYDETCLYFFTSADVYDIVENKYHRIHTDIRGNSIDKVEAFDVYERVLDTSKKRGINYKWVQRTEAGGRIRGIRFRYAIKF